MQSTLQGVAAAVLLALLTGGPALAQDAPQDATEPQAAPEAAEQAPEGETAGETASETASEAAGEAEGEAQGEAEAPAGESESEAAAPDGAAAGDPAGPEVLEIVRDTFGDWQVRCAPQGDDCFMYQLATDDEDNPVAEFSLLRLPAGSEAVAGVTVVTPLGTLLPPGLGIQVDTNEMRQYPFAWCSQVGCFSRFGLDNAAVNTMKRGRAGRITLLAVGAPEQPVVLDLSLTGFTAAFDSLEVPTAQ